VSAEKTAHLMAGSLAIASVTGGLAAAGQYLAAPWLAQSILAAPHLAPVLRVASLQVWLASLAAAQSGILVGFEGFRANALVQAFAGLTALPSVAAGAYYGESRERWLGCWSVPRLQPVLGTC